MIVQARHLYFSYGRQRVLDNATFSLPSGGIHALAGANGAGKSTLFRIMLGLATADSGSVTVFDEDSRQLSTAARQRLVYINDEHALPAWMSGIELAAMQRALYPQWDDVCLRTVLAGFDIDLSCRTDQLSRGERAGLNLALALAQRPQLMILDEPTLGLDVGIRRHLLEALMFHRDSERCTVLYATHYANDIERIADSLTWMINGRIGATTTPDALAEATEIWQASLQAPIELPGVLECQVRGNQYQWTVTRGGTDYGALLAAHGASHIQSMPASVEHAMTAHLAHHKKNQGKPQ